MAAEKLDLQAIFNEAIALESSEDRAKYLDEACGDNPEARQRVEKLLLAHSEAGDFFGGRSPQDATLIAPISESPGDSIGPYKLLQQIGEGGMGTVFMADQSEPVERRVALKIIKPGMDTQQVIARFEAERQALAMMDHPNIAKVLDAGTTNSGRPYFVMELVKGMPVTRYCDEQHLTPRERLELFVPICQAVQHAHQKGIIHRDLKPTNILIARYDDKPVPKIIDFGVAKATSHRLTEKTMFTQYGQIVGTMEYMSPEQANFNQLDVDTRSDIYSLGVLLYELLTGETPFDKQRLRSAAFDELLRIIREEEPPRPSTRLSRSESLANTAVNRKTELKKLSLLVRGELDWIVMKALEKDRTRRYETASKFAEDVSHYLNDEAVLACPPSASYKFGKFARRNKAVIGTTAVIFFSLTAGLAGTTWQAHIAIQEASRRKTAESSLELASIERREAEDALQHSEHARDLASDAEQRAVAAKSRADEISVQARRALAMAQELRRRAEQALNEIASADFDLQDDSAQFARGLALRELGKKEAAIEALRAAITLQPDKGSYHYALGVTLSRRFPHIPQPAELEEAVSVFQAAAALEPGNAEFQHAFGNALSERGRFAEATAAFRAAVEADPDRHDSRSRYIEALAMDENWELAAEQERQRAVMSPQEVVHRIRTATFLLLAGDDANYRKYAHQMAEHFAGTNIFYVAERTCLACLLLPEVIDYRQLPRDMLVKSLQNGSVHAGHVAQGWATLGLLKYRTGDPGLALKYATRAQESHPSKAIRAMSLTVASLAHCKLGHPELARTAVDRAQEILNQLLERKQNLNNTDLQIMRILLREAQDCIGLKIDG